MVPLITCGVACQEGDEPGNLVNLGEPRPEVTARSNSATQNSNPVVE